MSKKGFTLVEIIAVITIIALIIVLVVPGITESSRKAKYRSYLTKLESVKTAAIVYAQDNYKKIMEDGHDEVGEDGITYKVYEIKFKVLLDEERLVPDRKEPDPTTGGVFEDPRNTNMTLDNYIVKIKVNTKNRKIYAEIDETQNPA